MFPIQLPLTLPYYKVSTVCRLPPFFDKIQTAKPPSSVDRGDRLNHLIAQATPRRRQKKSSWLKRVSFWTPLLQNRKKTAQYLNGSPKVCLFSCFLPRLNKNRTPRNSICPDESGLGLKNYGTLMGYQIKNAITYSLRAREMRFQLVIRLLAKAGPKTCWRS